MLFALVALQLGQFQMPPKAGMPPKFAYMGEEAVLVCPPEVVSSAQAASVEWSFDGSHLLVYQQYAKLPTADPTNASPEGIIWVWSAETRKSTPILKFNGMDASVYTCRWFAGSNTGLIRMRVVDRSKSPDLESGDAVVWFDAKSGKTKRVTMSADGGEMIISPKLGVAASLRFATNDIVVYHSDGNASIPISFGEKNLLPRALGWDDTGRMLYFSCQVMQATAPGTPPTSSFFQLDAQLGSIVKLNDKPKITPGDGFRQQQGFNKMELKGMKLEGEPQGPFVSLWLKTDSEELPNRIAICGDVSNAALSPDGKFVAIVSNGVATVCPLWRLPKVWIQDQMSAARRAALMSNGKQVGLGMLMYAADNDDTFPDPSNWQDSVYPYIKNRSIMDGFVYTFGGGNAKDIKDPAGTMLGYIPGPGGRAIVYVDGHVKWDKGPGGQ